MNTIRRKWLWWAAPVAAAMLFTGASSTSASATVLDGTITGAGDPRNDWADEGPLLPGAHSNAVAYWQAVLHADGYISNSERNCWIDLNTTLATQKWQKDAGLPATGIVDFATFGEASSRLTYEDGKIRYKGPNVTYVTERNAEGEYGGYGDGKWINASYIEADAPVCKALPIDLPDLPDGVATPFA